MKMCLGKSSEVSCSSVFITCHCRRCKFAQQPFANSVGTHTSRQPTWKGEMKTTWTGSQRLHFKFIFEGWQILKPQAYLHIRLHVIFVWVGKYHTTDMCGQMCIPTIQQLFCLLSYLQTGQVQMKYQTWLKKNTDSNLALNFSLLISRQPPSYWKVTPFLPPAEWNPVAKFVKHLVLCVNNKLAAWRTTS